EAKTRRAALEDAGVVHAAIFDTLDACDLDPDGRPPPRARVFQLTRALLEKQPECEPARRRLGEELLASWRSDDVPVDDVIAWYAEAREHFPRAEWPAQIYATVLEMRSQAAEAGIAYAQAQRSDPADWRNHAGHGRALWNMGRTRASDARFRASAALLPTN